VLYIVALYITHCDCLENSEAYQLAYSSSLLDPDVEIKLTPEQEAYLREIATGQTAAKATGATYKTLQTVQPKGNLLELQPNPANELVIITYQLPENTQNASLEVFDINGRKLQRHKLTANSNSKQLDIQEFASGVR